MAEKIEFFAFFVIMVEEGLTAEDEGARERERRT
jgi:hypothetical protein